MNYSLASYVSAEEIANAKRCTLAAGQAAGQMQKQLSSKPASPDGTCTPAL